MNLQKYANDLSKAVDYLYWKAHQIIKAKEESRTSPEEKISEEAKTADKDNKLEEEKTSKEAISSLVCVQKRVKKYF